MNDDSEQFVTEMSQWGQCLSMQRDYVDIPVWFCTNRSREGEQFGFGRSNSVAFGRLGMRIPLTFQFGRAPSGSILFRMFLKDPTCKIKKMLLTSLSLAEFNGEIKRHTQQTLRQGINAQALIYVHGFRVSFDEAAVRAAHLAYDLKIPGPTAFFSWPSRGSVTAYAADEATIEASEQPLADFLKEFAENCEAKRVHVIAHSMGNRGLLRALQRIAASAEARRKVKFGQVILAAPDVDRDLFLDLARLYPEHAERTTLYASNGDLPVHLSAKLHDAPRAGYYTPYTVAPGVDTVAVPDFDIDLLGHSYFAQAEALLHDIYDLMQYNEAPAKRQRIAPAVYKGVPFWQLRR